MPDHSKGIQDFLLPEVKDTPRVWKVHGAKVSWTFHSLELLLFGTFIPVKLSCRGWEVSMNFCSLMTKRQRWPFVPIFCRKVAIRTWRHSVFPMFECRLVYLLLLTVVHSVRHIGCAATKWWLKCDIMRRCCPHAMFNAPQLGLMASRTLNSVDWAPWLIQQW